MVVAKAKKSSAIKIVNKDNKWIKHIQETLNGSLSNRIWNEDLVIFKKQRINCIYFWNRHSKEKYYSLHQ